MVSHRGFCAPQAMGDDMSIFNRFVAVAGMLLLAACGVPGGPVNSKVSAWNLTDTSVRFGPEISRTASGEEYGSNFVWNGYSGGNRKKQVIGMFRSAIDEVASEAMTGAQPVKVNVQVNYFHALTDGSRVWCCGSHRIFADLSVVDANSGAVLAEGKNVALGRVALGGIPGLVAVAAGRDQAVRIREGIAKGIRRWLAGN